MRHGARLRSAAAMRPAVASVMAGTLLCACAMTVRAPEVYPRDWPPPAADTSGHCAALGGRYQDAGAYSANRFDHAPQVSLARFFWRNLRPEPASGTVQLVPGNAETWRVSLFRAGARGLARSAQLSRELTPLDVRCEDGVLWLQPLSVPSPWRLGLRRSDTGFLIGEERLSSRGNLFVLPIAGRRTLWYKWPPAGS